MSEPMPEQQRGNNVEIPNWVVNQIGKLNLENEMLRNENTALRNLIQQIQQQSEGLVPTEEAPSEES